MLRFEHQDSDFVYHRYFYKQKTFIFYLIILFLDSYFINYGKKDCKKFKRTYLSMVYGFIAFGNKHSLNSF